MKKTTKKPWQGWQEQWHALGKWQWTPRRMVRCIETQHKTTRTTTNIKKDDEEHQEAQWGHHKTFLFLLNDKDFGKHNKQQQGNGGHLETQLGTMGMMMATIKKR